MKWIRISLFLTFVSFVLTVRSVWSAENNVYSFTPIDVPGAPASTALSLNDAGQIEGSFIADPDSFVWPTDPTNPSDGHYDFCVNSSGDPEGCFWITDITQPSAWDGWRDVNPFQQHRPSNTFHLGADYNFGTGANDKGRLVYPTSVGIVSSVQRNVCSFGNVIFVEHETSFGIYTSMYAHVDWLPKTSQSPGGPPLLNALVDPSVAIAKIGNGSWNNKNCTGPKKGQYEYHLHFEIREGANTDVRLANTNAQTTKGPEGQIDPNEFIQTHR